MWKRVHIWETGEVHTGFWLGDLRGKAHLEDVGVDGRIIFKWLRKTWSRVAWIGLIWLRIGMGSRLLWMRQWNAEFYKFRRISWLAEKNCQLHSQSVAIITGSAHPRILYRKLDRRILRTNSQAHSRSIAKFVLSRLGVNTAVLIKMQPFWYIKAPRFFRNVRKYEGWNFNSDNYLFTTDTK